MHEDNVLVRGRAKVDPAITSCEQKCSAVKLCYVLSNIIHCVLRTQLRGVEQSNGRIPGDGHCETSDLPAGL